MRHVPFDCYLSPLSRLMWEISLTIDADAIAQMSVCKDLLAMRNGQRCATPAARRGVEGLEGGHSCRKHSIS